MDPVHRSTRAAPRRPRVPAQREDGRTQCQNRTPVPHTGTHAPTTSASGVQIAHTDQLCPTDVQWFDHVGIVASKYGDNSQSTQKHGYRQLSPIRHHPGWADHESTARALLADRPSHPRGSSGVGVARTARAGLTRTEKDTHFFWGDRHTQTPVYFRPLAAPTTRPTPTPPMSVRSLHSARPSSVPSGWPSGEATG